MKNKHLVVISIDAMVTRDIEYAKGLPNFKRIIDGAAIIPSVKTIYPTLTHPIHATLITGAPASVTGVPNNLIFYSESPQKSKAWYNDLAQIKCDTLFHAAKRAGLTTAASSWPMTSYPAEYIDYLFPNALDFYFEGRENDPLSAYRSLGAQDCMMDVIESGIKKYGYKDVHPEVDYIQFHCAAEIVKRYKPNLLMMHPGNVDAARHRNGVWGEHIYKALREVDEMLGTLLSALEEAEILDSTDIVLLSDHGQIGVTRFVSPNAYLRDAGYITVDENGMVVDWKAYAQSAGGSAHVYLKNPDDKKLYDEVYSLLSKKAEEGVFGFEKVYTLSEVEEKYLLSGDFSFVLETDGYSSFTEHLTGGAVRGYDLGDYSLGKGKHGHAPEKGPQPVFIAKGPSFKENAVVPVGSILNHAPTLAAVLGLELLDSVGVVEKEILK